MSTFIPTTLLKEHVAALQKCHEYDRAQSPHPYFWAPFKLVGRIDPRKV